MLRICKNCGKEFNIRPSGVKKGKGKYCSIECYNKNRRKIPIPSKNMLKDLYWSQGQSLSDLARGFHVSDKTVRKWFKQLSIPLRPLSESFGMKKRQQPKLELSPSLAYIISVILGDGCVLTRKVGNGYLGRYIQLLVKDEAFANSFAKGLADIGLNYQRYISSRGYHIVIASSSIFYHWFKNLTFRKFREIALKFPIEFVRGFWESEGSIMKDKRRKTYYILRMGNTKIEYLQLVNEAIEKLGFKTKLYHNQWSNGCYHLEVRGSFNQKRNFLETINPCIRGVSVFPSE